LSEKKNNLTGELVQDKEGGKVLPNSRPLRRELFKKSDKKKESTRGEGGKRCYI